MGSSPRSVISPVETILPSGLGLRKGPWPPSVSLLVVALLDLRLSGGPSGGRHKANCRSNAPPPGELVLVWRRLRSDAMAVVRSAEEPSRCASARGVRIVLHILAAGVRVRGLYSPDLLRVKGDPIDEPRIPQRMACGMSDGGISIWRHSSRVYLIHPGANHSRVHRPGGVVVAGHRIARSHPPALAAAPGGLRGALLPRRGLSDQHHLPHRHILPRVEAGDVVPEGTPRLDLGTRPLPALTSAAKPSSWL